MPIRTSRLLTLTAVAALTAAACGDSVSDTSDPSGTGVPTVIATTSVWADITRNVACDGLAEVTTVIPAGGDPHSFEPSLRDREAMASATLIVANGLGLEESLLDTIEAVEADGVPVVRVGEFVDTLPSGEDEHEDEHDEEDASATTADDHDDDHDDDHGADDPHIWFDPTRVSDALPAIADALANSGIDRAALDACLGAYSDSITTLDRDIAAVVAPLPVEQRLLVTNHDSLSYFADRYDFEILGSVIPTPSSLAGTNPADLEALATLVVDTGVPAIFAETQHSSDDTEALADRVGDVAVVTLQTDTLGEPGSDTDTYVDWLTVTARTIVDALGEAV